MYKFVILNWHTPRMWKEEFVKVELLKLQSRLNFLYNAYVHCIDSILCILRIYEQTGALCEVIVQTRGWNMPGFAVVS